MNRTITFRALLCLVVMVFATTNLRAQEEADKFSFDASFNSDQFFGFYPFFQGGYAVSDQVSFTFYIILWSGGTGFLEENDSFFKLTAGFSL